MAVSNSATLGFEKEIWKAADIMRGNMDAAEYKHVILGLIFLKYISDRFEHKYQELVEEGEGFEEDRDEYQAENIFFVPQAARWSHIASNAHTPEIEKVIDLAMDTIEQENKKLKGILPKTFARPELDKRRLGDVVDLFTNVAVATKGDTMDLLGRTYEYCLGKFAEQEGKLAGEFYTPACVVRTLVEIIQPFNGRVYDPCCGSGGMFVQSAQFVDNHAGNINDLAVYGQDSNPTTWKLCQMNLAIRGIDADIGKQARDTFFDDLHPTMKADYIMANPPFNLSDWGADKLAGDIRWKYGLPPSGNANFAWMQHMIHHMSAKGRIGMVLTNGSLSSQSGGEGAIRKAIVEDDLEEGIIAMPSNLFYTVTIPVTLWFLNRNKKQKGKTLFIDARNMGTMVTRRLREMTDKDIAKIAKAFSAFEKGKLKDEAGFCAAVSTKEIAKQDYILTPGRYVGLAEQKDDLPAPRPDLFFVYVIRCQDNTIYIGQTDDLAKRWKEHKTGQGADWTRTHKAVRIVHYEEYPTREEAVAREKELKTTNGRRWLKEEISAGRARQAGGEPFEEKMTRLTTELSAMFKQSHVLEKEIKKQLGAIGFEI